jgi:hypothetical protein
MGYAESVRERAMTVHEVVLPAMSGEIHWFRAADILGISARTMRRCRERYRGFNVRHFCEIARREHQVTLSHNWVKHASQTAGLVRKGRALARPGVEHIPAYSPQARGRSERLNRTVQDRLANELRVAGITALAAANAYLRDVVVPHYNETFGCPPRDPEPAWVAVGDVDLEQILGHEEARVVSQDNIVAIDALALQVAKQPGRRTCAGLAVTGRRRGELQAGAVSGVAPGLR